MTTKLFRTPSSDPGIGMLARPIVPAVQESRRVVAESLRGNAIKIAVATDGQVLRWRAASNSLEPEALPATATDNVSSPPTDAELDAAFGQPGTLGDGFMGVLDDNAAGTTVWLCVAMNGAWWYEQLTKAV